MSADSKVEEIDFSKVDEPATAEKIAQGVPLLEEPIHISSKEQEPKPDAKLITLEEAKKQIAPEILTVLSDKFKGELAEVRYLDSKDILFP